jgi:predicted HTH transcriptional regulator
MKQNGKAVNPTPKREDFDRVLKAMLETPPVTREEVHKETGKRRKKAQRVIEGPLKGHSADERG